MVRGCFAVRLSSLIYSLTNELNNVHKLCLFGLASYSVTVCTFVLVPPRVAGSIG